MIHKIDHVGIAVRSIDEGRRLYEALGLHVEEIEEVEHEGVRVAMILCGESRIELLESTRDDSAIAKFLDKRGPGLHHLCLKTDDIETDSRQLKESGVRVLRPEPTRGAGGCWVQFVHPAAAAGVLVELSQDDDSE